MNKKWVLLRECLKLSVWGKQEHKYTAEVFFFVVIILSCLLKGAILTYRTCGGNHIWSECEVVYNERFSLSLWVCVRVFSPPTLFWPWGVCRKCPAHAASDENQQQLRTDLRGCCLEAEMLKPGVQRSTDQTGSRVEFVFLTWWSGDTSWLLANRALAAHTVTLRRLISPLYPEK